MLDPDLQVADKALWLLAIARAQSVSDAALLIKPVAVRMRMQNQGSRTPKIEELQSEIWLAVCSLLEVLEKGVAPEAELWEAAVKLTKNWRGFLAFS